LPAVPSMPEIKLNCSRRVVVFDTETTGLKPAVIVQLAYLVIENGTVVHEVDRILKLPEGVKIQKKAQEIHKVTNEMCARGGMDAEEALSEFLCLCRGVLAEGGTLVAHNSNFDSRAIRETCEKWQIFCDFDNDNVFCTMKNSKHFSPLLNKAGHKKYFRNEELYTHFYGSPPTWARLHNALSDVFVTTLNYAEGLKRGLW
jgi:DNA polymerase III epsilon subunit-like protein